MSLPRTSELALRATRCFRCNVRGLRIVKVELRGQHRRYRYALECMVCPGHGDIDLVKRDGQPVTSFILTSWGPSQTPPPIGQEFPLR